MINQIEITIKAIILLVIGIYGFAALLNKEDAAWVKNAPLKIMVGLYVIGVWGHIIWIPFAALMLCIPLLAKNRGDAAALFVVAALSLPDLYFKFQVGSFYVAAIDKYMFASFGLLIASVRFRREAIAGRRFDIPFLIVLVLELTQARDPQFTTQLRLMAPVLLTIALPYFLISRSLNSAEELRRFLLAIALTGFVMAIVATAEARLHTLFYQQITSNLPVSASNLYQKMRGGVVRAPTSFPESTSLANYLAAAGIAIIALRSSFASKTKRSIAFAVLLVGLVAPNSRGAFIGIALGLLAFDFYRNRWGPFFTKVGVAVGVYVVALMAAPFSPYIAEMVGKGADSHGSTQYRVQFMTRGLEEIRKHPYLGTTMKQALDNLEDLRTGEHIIDLVNGYITYGLTLGYTGIIGLVLVFATLSGSMLAIRRKLAVNAMVSDIAAFSFSVSCFMSVVAFFTTFGGEKSSFFFWSAAIGSSLYALRATIVAENSLPGVATLASTQPGIRARIEADRAAGRARARRLRGEVPDDPGGPEPQAAG